MPITRNTSDWTLGKDCKGILISGEVVISKSNNIIPIIGLALVSQGFKRYMLPIVVITDRVESEFYASS